MSDGWKARSAPIQPVGAWAGDQVGRFAWTPVPGASFYELQVSASPVFSTKGSNVQGNPPVDTCLTIHTTVTPANGVADSLAKGVGDCFFSHNAFWKGGTYYWRVRAHDGTGDTTSDWVTAGR